MVNLSFFHRVFDLIVEVQRQSVGVGIASLHVLRLPKIWLGRQIFFCMTAWPVPTKMLVTKIFSTRVSILHPTYRLQVTGKKILRGTRVVSAFRYSRDVQLKCQSVSYIISDTISGPVLIDSSIIITHSTLIQVGDSGLMLE